jgi:FkbM family methyltransferase
MAIKTGQYRGQNRQGPPEDQVIEAYFGATASLRSSVCGAFLDIGAADFETYSNSKLLWERGWSGVLVEPDPYALHKLLELHPQLPRIQLICAAFGERCELLRFWNSAGALVTTSDQAKMELWKREVCYRDMFFPMVTAADVEAVGGSHYDFVNLDVEGVNADVLKLLPLARWGVRCLCVEHDNRDAEILAYCAGQGLGRKLLRTAENLILAR